MDSLIKPSPSKVARQKTHHFSIGVRAFLFIALILASGNFIKSSYAQYDFNSNCISAYSKILSLDFQSGKDFIEHEKFSNPDNLIPFFLENYIDFLTLAIGEEQSDFEIMKPRRQERIKILSSGDPDSPWHRHSQAAVYLQWAFVRVKFGEYIIAGLDMNRAYRLLNSNKSEFPGFVPDLLLNGVMNALIGSIPENYKWAARLAGMEGSVEHGREELYQLLDVAGRQSQWQHLKAEAFFYLAFIEMNLQGDKKFVSSLLERMQNRSDFAYGALDCYIRANLSLRLGLNEKAIEILEHCQIADGSYQFHYLGFMKGIARLNRLDNSAAAHFLNFVNRYQGSNFIKTAYQRLAWLSLLNGNENAYNYYILELSERGQTFTDEDKQAQREAESGEKPNIFLLRARLLFDGGYYPEAIEILEVVQPADLTTKRDQVEFVYRKARIFHEWGKISQAKHHYRQTIETGSSLPNFFAGNAALQLGLIYESEGDYISATHYFDLCLKLKFNEYRTSIQQKARTGLRRISEKNTTR